MSGDLLTFEMATATEGEPSIFVKKDWLSILDNQNQNYVGNQIVLDTSQLANSNKYMNYREAYLMVPLLMTLTTATSNPANAFNPTSSANNADYAFGLKNWIGSIVHSFTLDYNGTTIIQQTPYSGLWNTFKLVTSLSYNDLLTQYSSIGFYPDNSLGWTFNTAVSAQGIGVCNNSNYITPTTVSNMTANPYDSSNTGFLKRQQAFNYDPSTSGLLSAQYCNQLFKSYIFNKVASSASSAGIVQQVIMGTIYLKHLHNFFDKVPLLKGVFMKFTLNINQPSVSFNVASGTANMSVTNMVNPLGGVNPIMLASCAENNGGSCFTANDYIISLNVGGSCLNSTQNALTGVQKAPLAQSVTLNVPAYTFAPTFETSYLSSPVKKVIYEDIYQYYIPQVQSGAFMNYLVTNGISNIKSVLILPYFYPTAGNGNMNPIQSPFDPAGTGPTSPLCLIGNFQVQISGQNMLYNTYNYTYNEWLQQLYGCNSMNNGLTDGLSSGLISQIDFENNYCYYYVNCDRELPVEQMIPKSVQILGQNCSSQPLQLYVFVCYGVEISIDALTGARV